MAITRGDLRQTIRKPDIEQRIWKYIHCHPSEIKSIIQDTTVDYQAISSEILLLADIFSIMDNEIISKINLIYPLIIDSTILHDETEEQLFGLIKMFKQKFEAKVAGI
jgi:hypothetical protein